MEFSNPPCIVHDVIQSLAEAKAEHLGWQIRAWQADKIHKEFGITGKNVTVGVGDTGVSRSHLNGELENVIAQKSFVGDDNPYDRNGHGSFCLSIVGAIDDSSGLIGYAPNCDLLSAKVLSDRGSGGDDGIASGIRWMTDSGARVISLSLGSPSSSSRINAAIQYAMDRGVLVFAAAGNDGRSNSVDNPAASSGCVPVGAVDSQLKLASFSDRGPQMTNRGVVGGGVRVYGCVANGFSSMSGTSMATPGVAGMAALMIEAEKEFLGDQITNSTTKFINLVDRFSVDLGATGDDPNYGNGAFDIYSYVQHLAKLPKPNPGGPTDPEPTDPTDPPGNDPITVGGFFHNGFEYTVQAEKKQP